MTITNSPFRTVDSSHDLLTHLVVMNPALIGGHPDQLPATTLCGNQPVATSIVPVHLVECERCLVRSLTLMNLPARSAQT